MASAVAVATAVFAGGLTACSSDDGGSEDDAAGSAVSQRPVGTVASLAVIEAGGGEWDGSGGLVLTDVASRGVWFTDRPGREAGSSSIPELVARFFDDQVPPNAALEFEGPDSDRQVVVVELSEPAYDRDGQSLSFEAQPIDDPTTDLRAGSALTNFVLRQGDADIPSSFDAATLFVDSTAEPRASQRGWTFEQHEGQTRFNVHGEVPRDRAAESIDFNCGRPPVEEDHFFGVPYIARDPSTPFSIFDAPRIDVNLTNPRAISSVTKTKVWPYEFGSALVGAVRITIVPGSSGTTYDITIWCTENTEDGWLVAFL